MFRVTKLTLKNVAAFFIIGLAGVLGHFVYEWSGGAFILGLFFPINESVWEHLKLLFFPSVLYFAAEYALTSPKPANYWQAVTRGIFAGMATIVVGFYTLSGISGKPLGFINILLYFVGVLVMLVCKNSVLRQNHTPPPVSHGITWGILALTAILFIAWSVNPPAWGIFIPPQP